MAADAETIRLEMQQRLAVLEAERRALKAALKALEPKAKEKARARRTKRS